MNQMIRNRSAPSGTIVPSLIYADVAKAADWLCDVFGFTERLRASGQDGTVGHAQLSIGLGGVILGASRTDGAQFRPPRANEVSQSLSVHVEDVDRHYQRATTRGARILQPPATYPYGERQYTAEDPEGHRWTFSQTVADVNPNEWGATASDLSGPLALLPRPRWCYLEIPAIDLSQSIAFYEKVFGWDIRHRESNHPSFADATGCVSAAWVTGRKISAEPGLLPYIIVDSIDATLAQAEANGAAIIDGPHLDSPGGQWIATFRDPAGNVMALYQEGPR